MSGAYGTYMMVLLTSAFALNLLDRQILNVLAEPIKRDLQLADWQLGALTGLSFALLHSVAALPIARLADRSDRVKIIGVAILAWSAFTAACGVAGNFVQLLLLRVGVGVGEAGCQPPSQSLIVDHYPPEKRSGALGKFGLGKPVGAAIGLAAGGLLAEAVGWRWTLVIAGAPGLLIGLLVLFTLKDPRQGAAAPLRPPQAPLGSVLRDLARRRSFLLFMLGMALLSFMSYGANAFAASFYLRVHGQDIARIGAAIGVGPLAVVGLGMGLIGATSGAIGSWFGGRLGDRWGARDVRAYALIPAIGATLGACSYVAMFTVPVGALSLALYMAPAFLNNVWNGPALLAIQNLAGEQARATAVALVLFVGSALGMGFGPLTIGAMSDAFATTMGEGEGLRLAIVLVAVVDLVAGLAFWLASRRIKDDLAAVASS
ncbi:MFS transporter [Phenylobacterium sp.]|uniref:spinster family MFS transporter n=1 Tax=Phenylobacterium sp. TaxID=1871053 RepID=UPI0025D96C56|nr:MFS transporter [Phenylobacterium sp.]